MLSPQKKCLIAAVPFSDNLGDALIHESLAWALNRNGVAATPLDIAGRKSFHRGAKAKSVKDMILNSRWEALRKIAIPLNSAFVALLNFRWWSTEIRKADFVIVGGGNLLSDVYLNFPLKLYFFALYCSLARKNYAVLYVGAAQRLSPAGKWFFRNLLTSNRCVAISVRDADSKRNIENLFGSDIASKVRVTTDPAVNLVDVYGLQVADRKKREPYVALNVVSPLVLMVNSDYKVEFNEASYVDWIRGTVKKIHDAGYKAILYTNGAQEDEKYLKLLGSTVNASHAKVDGVDGLVDIIRNADLVFATRLHSAITAFSMGVPFTAMSWDSKVTSFFNKTGLPSSMLFDFSTAGMCAHLQADHFSSIDLVREQVISVRDSVREEWGRDFTDTLKVIMGAGPGERY